MGGIKEKIAKLKAKREEKKKRKRLSKRSNLAGTSDTSTQVKKKAPVARKRRGTGSKNRSRKQLRKHGKEATSGYSWRKVGAVEHEHDLMVDKSPVDSSRSATAKKGKAKNMPYLKKTGSAVRKTNSWEEHDVKEGRKQMREGHYQHGEDLFDDAHGSWNWSKSHHSTGAEHVLRKHWRKNR